MFLLYATGCQITNELLHLCPTHEATENHFCVLNSDDWA